MIVDLAKQTSIVLMPQQKQYVENKRAQIPGQGVTFFQAKDVEDACEAWKKMAHAESGKCRKGDHEPVNGRDTIRYDVSPGQGKPSPLWIDVKLHVPIKWQNAVAAGELRNIKEEVQPADLFQIQRDTAEGRTRTRPTLTARIKTAG